MNLLNMSTHIQQFDTLAHYFSDELLNGALIVTSTGIKGSYLSFLKSETPMICHDQFGKGEPTDTKITQMIAEKNKYDHDKIIAIGGGTVMDCAKLMVIEGLVDAEDAFTGKHPLVKALPLICIPTTCGTGSEVTAVTVAELTQLNTKKGLSHPALQPDEAILIPELLKDLPIKPFMHAAIDALIHASESYLSPKASNLTRILSLEAIRKILKGFQQMAFHGVEKRMDFLDEFLIASCYAGIAFGNAGVGAVHALSYPLGGTYHVPHGEANFQFFTAVFNCYYEKAPSGNMNELVKVIAQVLDCPKNHVFNRIDHLLVTLTAKPPLKSYGMTESDIEAFTQSVMNEQQRLLANNYVALSEEEIKAIYSALY
ncbi:MAG: iron-containing alcohol dehydrogenase [Clostridia bacterium]|nr:iron-containing alcohol dehydrogenase [Clostridia bacterium]